MNHRTTTLLLLSLVTAIPATATAGPWVPANGHGYAKVGTRALLGGRYTDGLGTTTPIARYRELTTSVYGEYGVGRSLALLLQWDIARVFQLSRTDPNVMMRPGDLHLGARWAPIRFGRGVISFDGWLGVPLASSDSIGTLLSEDGQPLAQLRAGPGVFDVGTDARIGWAWTSVYTSASIGWLQRFGGQDGGVRWSAEVGGRWSVLRGALRLGGWHSLETGDAPRLENPAALTNGTKSTSTIFELGVALTDNWTLGATSQVSLAGLDVRRHVRGGVFSLFLSFER